MVKRKPVMRYPLNLERAYAKNIDKYISEMDDVVQDILKKEIAPGVLGNEIRADKEFVEDFSLKNIQRSLSKLSLLFRGIFPTRLAKKEAEKVVRSVANQNKTAMNQQLRVRGISLLESESWLPSFMKTKVAENVSYIEDIPETYFKSIEQSVLRTVSNGASLDQLAEDIQKASDKAHDKAIFIARDQVGSMLGQMNAERQQKAGFPAFRWSDSGDNRVRPSHKEKNGKIFQYKDNPVLPGEDYGCRCIAEPVDQEELDEYLEIVNQEETAYNYIKRKDYDAVQASLSEATKAETEIIHGTYDEREGYVATKNSYFINRSLRNNQYDWFGRNERDLIQALDSAIEKNVSDRDLLVDRWVDKYWLETFFKDKRAPNKVDIDSLTELLNKYKHSTFIDNGYSSASLIPEKNLMYRRPIRIVIEAPEGTHLYAPDNKVESEVIFGRNSEFEIILAEKRFNERGPYIELRVRYKKGGE